MANTVQESAHVMNFRDVVFVRIRRSAFVDIWRSGFVTLTRDVFNIETLCFLHKTYIVLVQGWDTLNKRHTKQVPILISLRDAKGHTKRR